MGSTGFSHDLFLYQEQANSKPLKDIIPFLPTPGSRQGISRTSIDVSHGHNDLRKLRNGLQRYNQYINYLAIRRISLPAEYQDVQDDSVLSNRKDFLEFLMSASSDLKEDYPGPSIMPEFRELQAIPTDMHLKDVASIKFQLDNCFTANESFPHAYGYPYNQENDYDFAYDAPYQSVYFHPEGNLSLVDSVSEMKDLSSILAELAVIKDSAKFSKQQMLVPHFTWSDAIDLQNHEHPSLMVESVTASPLKSPKRVKQKSASKKKTRKATTDRNLYRTNSLHAFETILSLMVDTKRSGKSLMNSLEKSSPELPQLLTQFSASITGTGLAVMFSVVYKVACGTVPFSMSNLLTSGFGIGLFWLSWAVNRLRDTIMYIRRNFSKMGVEEERQMITRVDESVKAILFRIAALMAVMILRFA